MSVEEPRSVLHRLPSVKNARRDAFPRYVGYLGFEAGRQFDPGIGRLPAQPNPLKTPAVFWGDYRAVLQLNVQKGDLTLIWRGNQTKLFNRLVDRIKKAVNRVSERQSDDKSLYSTADLRSSLQKKSPTSILEKQHFTGMVQSIKDAIARGDVYQTNISLRFERSFNGDPRDLYRSLCEKNPSPYAGIFKCGDHWLVSNSPELLVKVEKGRAVTRPIAGTRPRSANARLDAVRRGQLLLSPKERAEHIMLVDLERNDLGRVCKPGSVNVTETFSVEKYSHVMHIVSEVEGQLAPRKNALDALKALFPGGTITGCPKIRSIELIEDLERVARGPFYGSAGFIAGNGDAVFNILIRTALIKDRRAWVQAGAGIVADSNPGREYREVHAKAAALLEALGAFS